MSPTTAKTPDVSRRSERSRQAILRASMELVGEVGYPKLTIEAIAARAGVGKQTIYRWWPSKAAVLLDACTDAATGDGHDSGLPDTGDVEADLKTVLRATADEFSDPPSRPPTAPWPSPPRPTPNSPSSSSSASANPASRRTPGDCGPGRRRARSTPTSTWGWPSRYCSAPSSSAG
ncbi:hypothetical protein TPA0909_61020 [Streptomyces albus]|nr:hypothetical protein TPA0909_61020 [Streptomyces albus]